MKLADRFDIRALGGVIGFVVVSAILVWMFLNGSLSEFAIRYLGTQSETGREVFIALSAAGDRTCGLRADGRALCWGKRWDDAEHEEIDGSLHYSKCE